MKLYWRTVRPGFLVSLWRLPILVALGGCDTRQPAPASEDPLRFARDIEPIVSKFCFECHGDEELEAELDLRSVDSILKGGESGPAIVPGHPDQSILLDMIHDEHMPPEGELLTASDIEQVRRWIAAGALP